MIDKLNCWDFRKCCDKSMSHHASKSIVCPVKKELKANGLNGGINGGRICWVIMDSHCKKKAQSVCFQCEFRYKVMAEEGLLNNCNATGTVFGIALATTNPITHQHYGVIPVGTNNNEPENCWEFWDCPNEERDDCPAFLTYHGMDCYDVRRKPLPKNR